MHVLVTGGAGYIGSHTCLSLLESGMDVTVIDNFCNSSPEALQRVQSLTGRSIRVIEADVRDAEALETVFSGPRIDAVIHFAGLKAVGESVAKPMLYYDNNVAGTFTLLQAMQRANVSTLVFSSSATVYGDPAPEHLPLKETAPCGITHSPYATSKWTVERCLADLHAAQPEWRIARLRYFNPVGAHSSGRIGENPSGTPNNLMPFVSQVACGARPKLSIFGDDYPTHDGTGVRDYIHVMDLAEGHVATLKYLASHPQGELLTLNLGTGQGCSVLDVVKTFETASGRPVPYEIVPRRPGDVPAYYADPSQAQKLLHWRATRSLRDMCADTWRWQAANPQGYDHR
ncbi:UDP-glucose 4-epimerase GalE [Ottowia thiooxydans]|uniref:UDP-glucose 4-epimerase GalE n=1 Tax=Ottowia thiooxydans TaxID=219182 RepID=UPI0004106E88|nr:UDP-glucose 4-epimerase GalE [Ottowia thiooxydans]